MTKKKIAFVVAVPRTATAFLKDHIVELIKYFDVHLIANFSNADDKEEFKRIGVVCHSIPIQRKISVLSDLNTLFELFKIFRREKFDSIHSVTPKAGLLNAIAGWFAHVPNRIHIYTGQVWATRKGIMRCMLKSMDKLPAVLNTVLLVDGFSQRKFLIEEGVLKEQNSLVLAKGSISGVKLERFIISESVRLNERKKFNFTYNDVVFIFLGRLNHDKGIGELYEAFNQLVVECPHAKLVLYGVDEEGYEEKAKSFSNLIRNQNFFYPGLTRQPYDALQCGDVFVLPTWREGFGTSVLEAQALAIPVITSDTYGVVDASVPNVTGLRCGVNDPKGLYKCMKMYYEDAQMRKQHGENGRKRIVNEFNSNFVTAAWVDFYHELLEN